MEKELIQKLFLSIDFSLIFVHPAVSDHLEQRFLNLSRSDCHLLSRSDRSSVFYIAIFKVQN